MIRFAGMALFLPGTACSTSTGTTDSGTSATAQLDDDGDGLTNGEEAALGTDPALEDSDGDGHSDGEEVDGNTDPLDDQDRPYAGGWPIADCRDGIASTGNSEGDIADDFTLMDQFGEQVRLHSFCDRLVVLVGSAFW